MPLTGNTYQQRRREQILAFLEAELRNEFGENIDLTESSAFRTFAEALSTVDSNDIEPALETVHNAAFLDSAEGQQLDDLVDIVGIKRREAVHATGTVEFRHGSLVGQDYTINNGTVVQTRGMGGIEYETTENVTLTWFDDFEDGALRNVYDGQRADFSVVDGSAAADPSPTEGTYQLKSAAVSGSKVFSNTLKVTIGQRFSFHNYLSNDTATAAVAGNIFGLTDSDDYYRTKIDASGAHAIELSVNGSITSLASSSYTPPTGEWLRNEIVWSPENRGTIISRLYDSTDTLVDEIQVTDEDTIEEGGFGFESLDGSENKYWDHSACDRVRANIRASQSGPEANVGGNTITDMPSVPSGVNTVTNPFPTGDDSHYLTDLTQYTAGRRRESDEEFRERSQLSEGARGSATAPSVLGALNALPGAESVRVIQNKDDTADDQNRPPTSFEAVYYGTDPDQDVAETIFDEKAFTGQDVGGYVGTAKSYTVEAENGQTFTVNWTEPTELAVDMTLDIVVNDEFIGEDPLREQIVAYIGGTFPDGTSALGTGVGEDVYVDQVEDVVTGPDDTGVIGISSYTFTPSVTTDANGLEVVSVGSNEVAVTDGSDTSIAFNITRV